MFKRKRRCNRISLVLTTALLLGPIGFAAAEPGGRQGRDEGKNVIKLKDGKATINGDMKGAAENYTVELKKDQPYTISMTARFDTLLRVRDKNGKLLALDDDGGVGLNSKLVFKPNETAPYTVVATSFDQEGRGPYTLRVSKGTDIADKTKLVKIKLQNGKFTANGNLKTPVDVYVLTAKQGERFVINMTSQKFDTFIVIVDNQKKAIAKDDDGGEGLNSRLVFNPPATGTYFIAATSFGARGRGAYLLTVVRENE